MITDPETMFLLDLCAEGIVRHDDTLWESFDFSNLGAGEFERHRADYLGYLRQQVELQSRKRLTVRQADPSLLAAPHHDAPLTIARCSLGQPMRVVTKYQPGLILVSLTPRPGGLYISVPFAPDHMVDQFRNDVASGKRPAWTNLYEQPSTTDKTPDEATRFKLSLERQLHQLLHDGGFAVQQALLEAKQQEVGLGRPALSLAELHSLCREVGISLNKLMAQTSAGKIS